MRRPYTLGRCACCGGNRLLKYAKRTHCCRYRCQKAAAALLAAANEDAEDDLAPTFAKSIEFILGQRFCDPEELNDEKRRNILSSSDFKRCYLIDGIFATSASDDGFRDKRWVEIDELVEKISEPETLTRVQSGHEPKDRWEVSHLRMVRAAQASPDHGAIMGFVGSEGQGW